MYSLRQEPSVDLGSQLSALRLVPRKLLCDLVNICMHHNGQLPKGDPTLQTLCHQRAFLRPGKAQSFSLPQEHLIHNYLFCFHCMLRLQTGSLSTLSTLSTPSAQPGVPLFFTTPTPPQDSLYSSPYLHTSHFYLN